MRSTQSFTSRIPPVSFGKEQLQNDENEHENCNKGGSASAKDMMYKEIRAPIKRDRTYTKAM